MSRFVRIVVAVALAAVGVFGFVSPGGAADQQQVAQVQKTAYYTRPASTATPPTLTNGFPPSTACLVAGLAGLPELCGEQVADIGDQLGLGGGLPVPETIDSSLVQPVLPATLPIGMAGGQERYSSLIRFELPELPEGQEFAKIELLMRPDGLSYAVESPVFRELVLAAISQISEQDPSQFADVFSDVASGETAVFAESITGIEACPATEAWDDGNAQNAGVDGERVPDVDCLVGTTGEFDTSNSTWVFDITFAAQAWTTGGLSGESLANEGLLLRPLGADNLAYGDPDVSTNWMVSLANQDAADDLKPRLRYSIAPSAPAVESITPDLDLTPSAPSATPSSPAGPSSQIIENTAAPQTQTVLPGGIRARYAQPASVSTGGSSPWWLLLIAPLLLGGAWSLGESIFALPDRTSHRAGALDRLMRTHANQGDVT
ncbi:hypothetical protein [Actinospongicola halichondriae]|uniref:hypothetical protein n=1 Tax=Actinospongicola halichondriae TaxID=3236844 RepID=UPI003D555924